MFRCIDRLGQTVEYCTPLIMSCTGLVVKYGSLPEAHETLKDSLQVNLAVGTMRI